VKFRRSFSYAMPARPIPKDVFAHDIELFMSQIPDHASVEMDCYTEKGDPPYNPDVKHASLEATWIDEDDE
jgi:hypothetical protein